MYWPSQETLYLNSTVTQQYFDPSGNPKQRNVYRQKGNWNRRYNTPLWFQESTSVPVQELHGTDVLILDLFGYKDWVIIHKTTLLCFVLFCVEYLYVQQRWKTDYYDDICKHMSKNIIVKKVNTTHIIIFNPGPSIQLPWLQRIINGLRRCRWHGKNEGLLHNSKVT